MSFYMGVDPGKTGAIAFYKGYPKRELYVYDMVLTKESSAHRFRNPTHKNQIAVFETGNQIKEFMMLHGEITVCLLETPHSIPSDGHVGAFTFGKMCGLIEGMIGTLGIDVVPILPVVWKPQLGLSSSKAKSLTMAIELFGDIPGARGYFTKTAHDGRAEAAILAWLAHKKFSGET